MTRNENGESPVSVLLRGVLIYGEGEPTDVLVGDGTILEIGVDLDPATASEVIDAAWADPASRLRGPAHTSA